MGVPCAMRSPETAGAALGRPAGMTLRRATPRTRLSGCGAASITASPGGRSCARAFSGEVCSTSPVRKRDKAKTYRAFSDSLKSENALALQLLAPQFERQPFVLGGGELRFRGRERRRRPVEGGPVAAVEAGIGETGLQPRDLGLQGLDLSGERLQRVLLVEGKPGPAVRAGARPGPRRRLALDRLRRRNAPAALGEYVRVAARIFGPAPGALRHDHGGHDAVEDIAVVADEEHGAGVIGQHFL